LDVVVDEEAVGIKAMRRMRTNVGLASELTGCDIEFLTEYEEARRKPRLNMPMFSQLFHGKNWMLMKKSG